MFTREERRTEPTRVIHSGPDGACALIQHVMNRTDWEPNEIEVVQNASQGPDGTTVRTWVRRKPAKEEGA